MNASVLSGLRWAFLVTGFLLLCAILGFSQKEQAFLNTPMLFTINCPEPGTREVTPPAARLRWDQERPYFPAPPWDKPCRLVNVRIPDPIVARYRGTYVPFRMCVRQEEDIVSSQIHRHGRWGDCDSLVDQWHLMTRDLPNTTEPLFLDVGANIGACSLLMLSVGARVVAFEPLPANLYYLTRSLFLQPRPVWANRLTLFPVALGANASVHRIYSEAGNAGNSVLDTPTHASRDSYVKIHVETMDDMLWPHPQLPPPYIALMKMDIQGYEMEALKGARRLLKAGAIRALKTEVAVDWLREHGSSAHEFCSFLQDVGHFDLRWNDRPLHRDQCAEWDQRHHGDSFGVDVTGFLPLTSATLAARQ